jgi:hypothetical protein
MRRSDAVVVCLSENISARSRSEVFREIKEAQEVGRRMRSEAVFLIPLVLSPCEVPSELAELQLIDCCPPEYEIGIGKLLDALDFARSVNVERS